MKCEAAIIVLISLCGCMAEQPPVSLDERFVCEAYVLKRWLPFVSQGATEEVIIRRLGEPTEVFENGRIIVFDLVISNDMVYQGELYHYDASFHNRRRRELSQRDDSLVVVRPGDEFKRPLLIKDREAEYSLVLVFDDFRKLRSFRLLRIKP
jgi:hypothetical protein